MPRSINTGQQLRRRDNTAARRIRVGAVAAAAAIAVLAGACSSEDTAGNAEGTSPGGEGPVVGGEVVYGLEAETSNGWCIPEATLAISGIMVTRALYDTLMTPDDSGGYAPYLAESLVPSEDFTQWTLTLREGVTFHDGTELDAQVVKNNIDAWLGRYPNRNSALLPFVFENIDIVEIVDGTTLTITTKKPWPALPAYLYGGGRLGIMAQSQLDDTETCDAKMVGTGPFVLEEWAINDHLSATKNPDYWATDADGTKLPYLDRITFRPIVDPDARVNAFLAGELDLMHTASAPAVETLEEERDSGNIGLVQSLTGAEVSYLMLNSSKPPFNSPVARRAMATALDRDLYQEVRTLGLFPMASGPFPPGTPGHLEDAGFPEYDLAEAKRLVAEYESETGSPLEFSYVYSGDNAGTLGAQFIQEQLAKAGITANLRPVEQATLINTALGNDWNAIPYRNHPGSTDGNYIWWYGGSPVNFGKFNDPEINSLLDAGRVEADPDKARAIYEDINRRFGSEVYNVWLDWTEWNICTAIGVGGVGGPELPNGAQPNKGLATGHSVAGLWNGS